MVLQERSDIQVLRTSGRKEFTRWAWFRPARLRVFPQQHKGDQRTMMKKILVTGFFVGLLSLPAFGPAFGGEFYQYKDRNGNMRFTDNLADVPADQQQNMKTYEAVEGSPVPPPDEEAQTSSLNPPEQGSPAAGIAKDESDKRAIAAELDKTQAELKQRFKELVAEKAALAASAPKKGAKSIEKGPYIDKVDALNANIKQYEKDREVFEKRVKAFNESL